MIKEFAGTHAHSMFSFMDGIASPEEVVLAAKAKGLRSIALTEHGHMHSMADLYLAGKKHGVRTLYGVEAYVVHDLDEWSALRERMRAEKRARLKGVDASDEIDDFEERAAKDKANRRLLNRKGHLVMLATSQRGLSSLFRIVHAAHKRGMYMKPRADKAMIKELAVDVVATSACMGGVVSNKCWQMKAGEGTWADVVREAEEFNAIFGRGRFFLELQFNETEGQLFINECIVRLHRETGIPLTVTTDSHYVDPVDWRTQELVHLLRSKTTTFGTLPEGYRFDCRSLFVKGAEEMWRSYEEWGQGVPFDIAMRAFEGALVVDGLIEQFEPDTRQRLPTLPYEDPFQELGERAIRELAARGLDGDERYRTRLLYELEMIADKGIGPYFLVVQKVVDEARNNGILVGPGRGSSAGSLVCYLLGITNIDPIEHRLMFERFINVDRIEIPDIDLDFSDVDAVKDLLRRTFGDDNVACISTYGTNQIKGVLKDVGRVYDIDHNEINRTNARIDNELQALFQAGDAKSAVQIKLEDVYRLSSSFNSFIRQFPQVEEPVKRLYGRVHHVGRHASGVIVGDDLPGETAVFYSKGVLQASFTDGIASKHASEMGLVKIDVLGLATLSVIKQTAVNISKRGQMSYQDALRLIDPKMMDFNDQRVLRTVFWQDNMCSIFQCTSRGMRKLARQMKPDCFDDIAALGALYRPGPLGSRMDQLYIENKEKAKRGDVAYEHPILEEILKDTYGTFVYQEHILELGRKLGKLSWKDTNRLRKLFLKRTKAAAETRDEEAEELKEKLTAGFLENGMSKEYAERTWQSLLSWGRYGFNSAHAKSYGMLTMQTAFLRTYYPLEFFAAALSCGQSGEIQQHVEDIVRQGFSVLPVDVNHSGLEHEIQDGAIRLSITCVKGVGVAAAAKILAARGTSPFMSFIDFVDRSGATKTSIEGLLDVGAFESVEPDPWLARARFDAIRDPKLRAKKRVGDRERLYREAVAVTGHVEELARTERERLGFNVRWAPFSINRRRERVDRVVADGLAVDYEEFIESAEPWAAVPCVVQDVRERPQRNGKMFAFIRLSSRSGASWESPAFANVWRWVKDDVGVGVPYLVVLSRKDDSPRDLVVGLPGFGHTADMCRGYFLPLDEFPLPDE